MAGAFYCLVCGGLTEFTASVEGQPGVCSHCGAEHQLPEPSEESGQVIHRHQVPSEFNLVIGDEECIKRVSEHITRHLGPVAMVFHEVLSDIVHIDVHTVEGEGVQWLVTSGMSSLPMTVPEGMEDWARVELCLAVPPDWPLTMEAFEQERYYWPIRLLKELARLPHQYRTWLGHGHSIPNGSPPEPYAPDTLFQGCLISFPELAPAEFFALEEEGQPTIHFWGVYPVYLEEMNEKLIAGADAVLERMLDSGITELVDLGRKNVSLPN